MAGHLGRLPPHRRGVGLPRRRPVRRRRRCRRTGWRRCRLGHPLRGVGALGRRLRRRAHRRRRLVGRAAVLTGRPAAPRWRSVLVRAMVLGAAAIVAALPLRIARIGGGLDALRDDEFLGASLRGPIGVSTAVTAIGLVVTAMLAARASARQHGLDRRGDRVRRPRRVRHRGPHALAAPAGVDDRLRRRRTSPRRRSGWVASPGSSSPSGRPRRPSEWDGWSPGSVPRPSSRSSSSRPPVSACRGWCCRRGATWCRRATASPCSPRSSSWPSSSCSARSTTVGWCRRSAPGPRRPRSGVGSRGSCRSSWPSSSPSSPSPPCSSPGRP